MSKARDLANAGTALTTVSATELGYLDGVTSAVQTQLNAKQAVVSGVDSTEIGYLDGVTSAIQTQINAQIPKSIVDAKGDIIAASAADTVARLAVGSNDTVLTADSSTATGLKWATAAAGGFTVIASGSLSGSSVSLTSIPNTYKNLQVVIQNVGASSGFEFRINLNSDTGGNYGRMRINGSAVSSSSSASNFLLGGPNMGAANNGMTVICDIYDYANSTTRKILNGYVYKTSNSGDWSMCNGGYDATGTVTSVQLGAGSATFTGGTYILYGVS